MLSATAVLWIWIIAGAVLAVGAGVAAYFAVRTLRRRIVTRALVALVGRREAVLASRRTLEAVIRHLADGDDESLEEFAAHPQSEDRRALVEVARRMEIAVEELDITPVPGSLVPVAEGLADAAYVIFEESGRVGEALPAEEVFEALAAIDLTRVSAVFDAADLRVKNASERYHLDEASVYGGGLYI